MIVNIELDPDFRTRPLGGTKAALSWVDGADDEENETKDRCGTEGKDRLGGGTRALDHCGSRPTLPSAPKPDLCLEETTPGASGAGV